MTTVVKLNDDEDEEGRFFTSEPSSRKGSKGEAASISEVDVDGVDNAETRSLKGTDEDVSDEDEQQHCMTIRLLQKVVPCLGKEENKNSQLDLLQEEGALEAQYPKILKTLERPIFTTISVFTGISSVLLLFFSAGFLIESHIMWAIIHFNNFIFTSCVAGNWLGVIIKSKFAKTQRYTTTDILLSFLSVFPLDSILLLIHQLTRPVGDDKGIRGTYASFNLFITVSRLGYFLRLRYVGTRFTRWENDLLFGNIKMFAVKTAIFMTLFVHANACIWHRLACKPFNETHFNLKNPVARNDVCGNETWVSKLIYDRELFYKFPHSPLLQHEHWPVLFEHYITCVYWSMVTVCRLGATELLPNLLSWTEVSYMCILTAFAWGFVLVYIVSVTASILLESETDAHEFQSRRWAIHRFMDFVKIDEKIKDTVDRFYDSLLKRNQGIHYDELVEHLPPTMKADIFYDINKHILLQIPLLANLEESFLLNLSIYMDYRFFLKGHLLQEKGRVGNAFHFLIKGYLEVLLDDNTTVITEIRSGSAIGEIYLMHAYPISATVRCGTECDMMTLSRDDFRKVLKMYPEYKGVLQKRIDGLIDQSHLLLTLCEKQNHYVQAFRKLQEFEDFEDMGCLHRYKDVDDEDLPEYSTAGSEVDPSRRSLTTLELPQQRDSLEQAIGQLALAIETDVTMALSLSNELNIARAPLVVSAPNKCRKWAKALTALNIEENYWDKLSIPKIPQKGEAFVIYKFLMMFPIAFVIFYYPYRLAFYNHNLDSLDWVGHACECLIALDCLSDLFQPIYLPDRTLRTKREILSYKCRTFYFYVRIFAFLPIEYVMGPICGWNRSNYRFYIFKLNRLLLYGEGRNFFALLGDHTRIPTETLVILQFAVRLVINVNFVACILELILKFGEDLNPEGHGYKPHPILDKPENRHYDYILYFAMQLLTSAGFGDFPLRRDAEIAAVVIAVILGTILLLYVTAKLTAVLANKQRTKAAFNQVYYGFTEFMKQRKLEKGLKNRVLHFFQLQWQRHKGLLIRKDHKVRAVLFDTPQSILHSICYAQGRKYIERIPLFMHCSPTIITEVCETLRQYTVPGKELLLSPNYQSRHLTIIVKGFCRVYQGDRVLGKLGPGSYFGLGGLLYGSNPHYKVESINNCQLFCLDFESVLKITDQHPKFFEEYKILTGQNKFPKGVAATIPPQDWTVFPKEATEPSYFKLEPMNSTEGKVLNEVPPSKARRICDAVLVRGICPYGRFIQIWTVFRLMLAFLVGNFAPAQFSFSVSPQTAFMVILLCDLVAWIDIIICFRVGYYGERNQLITHWRKTCLHYLKGPFILDLLACLPIELFVIASDPKIKMFGEFADYNNQYWLISGLRLTRMLQCYRFFVIEARILSKIVLKSLPILALVQVIPLMALFLNAITCASIHFVCGPSLNGEPIHCENKEAFIINGEFYNSNYNPDFYNKTIMEEPFASYTISLYWTMSTAFRVGFGDFDVIRHHSNRRVATGVLFIGALVTTYLIAKWSASLVAEDWGKTLSLQKTRIMFQFLDRFGVPKDLQMRVEKFYAASWRLNSGAHSIKLISSLHPSLKSDLLKTMYDEILRQSPIFVKLDDQGIRTLAVILKERFYPESEFLMAFGDLDGDVYYIANGLVACYTEDGKILGYVGKGSILGKSSCLLNVQRQYTAVAATDCEIYVFPQQDFLKFVDQFEEVGKILQRDAARTYEERLENSQNLEVATSAYVSEYLEEQTTDVDSSDQLHGEISMVAASVPQKEAVRMLFGSAIEVPLEEAKKDPEFFEDPLKEIEKEAEGQNEYSQKTRRNKILSFFITFGKVPRDDMGCIHIVQQRKNFNIISFVIHPASPICSHDTVFLFLTAMSCALVGFEISFETPEIRSREWPLYIRVPLELYFLLRMIGNFHLAYYDQGRIVLGYKKILRHYLRDPFGFALDLITIIPLFAIFYIPSFEGWRLSHPEFQKYHAAAFIRGIKLLRAFYFPRYLSSRNGLPTNLFRAKIIRSTILWFLVLHICACIWYSASECDLDNLYCQPSTWIGRVIKTLSENNNHTIKSDLDVDISMRYLYSLFYITTTVTLTGLADEISARTKTELYFTIVLMFASVFVMGYLVGIVTRNVASQFRAKIRYRNRLNVLLDHLTILGLPPQRLQSVKAYFQLFWARCTGFPCTELLQELPYTLRADVTMFVYGRLIENTKLLGKLDYDLIRQLSVLVKHEIYTAGSHIVRSGDICSCVYFVRKGEVAVLDDTSGQVQICVDMLYENECFGEIKVFLDDEQFRFSYLARLEAEIGVLSFDDIAEVLEHREGILTDLIAQANKIKSHRIQQKDEEDRISTLSVLSAAKKLEVKHESPEPDVIEPKPERTRMSALFGIGASSNSGRR